LRIIRDLFENGIGWKIEPSISRRMPNGTYVIIALLVLAVLVAVILPMAQRTTTEGFDLFGGASRADYIDRSKQLYNKFSSPMDPRIPNFARVSDPAGYKRVNQDIQDATRTSTFVASGETATSSGLATVPEGTTFQLPPDNKVLQEAKKCEALRGRDACSALSDPNYANCGVCLKEGSPYTIDGADNKFIGGLLVLPEDRQEALAQVGGDKSKVQYRATVGSCPPGYLHVTKDTCQRRANQLDCKEVGQTGGFNGGKTIEGKAVGLEKCAFVPNAGEDAYVYDPKNRRFNVGLRVLAPTGTGICRVIVQDTKGNQKGAGQNSVQGREFVVQVKDVAEGEELVVIAGIDAPYRPAGKAEVFQVVNNDTAASWPNTYNQTQASAKAVCERLGAAQATKEQLNEAWRNGAQLCGAGWTSDGFNGYPMQQTVPGCGLGNTVNEWFDSKPNRQGHSWCYGIKPPQSWNTLSWNFIGSFYEPYEKGSEPIGQKKWSQHGTSYQAPYYRAILMQWEMANANSKSIRTVAFEPTITKIDDANPDNIAVNGAKTFRVLRRYGTYAGSNVIRTPKPSGNTGMMTDMYWIWSANALKQSVKFNCQVPGTFMNTFYNDEPEKMNYGPLVTNPKTLDLLRRSPCVGQQPGKYSIDCLQNLFIGSGGDPVYGRLAIDDGGLVQLNRPIDGKLLDMDGIANYLANLYSIATAGRDIDGNPVADMDTINDAAQKMLGVSLITPCDNIVVDGQGNVSLTPKTPPLDAPCLNHLYLNAGSDKDRTLFDRLNKQSIGPTYTSLMDRYSGLKKTEGSKKSRKQYPFQACQRTGTLAPVSADGKINDEAMMAANKFGTIGEIQDFYDGVHKFANYKGGSSDEEDMKKHNAAVEACYGVKRSSGFAGRIGCGIKAQYIRVLPSASDKDRVLPVDANVAIYDGNNRMILTGKTSTVAGQYWIDDLGSPTDINKVVFVPNPSAGIKQVGSVVQLLDANRKIVAQKLVGEKTYPKYWGQPETITFTGSDTKTGLAINDILDGTTPFSLESAIMSGAYLKHNGGNTFLQILPPDSNGQYSQSYRDNATFRIRPGVNKDPTFLSIVAATMNLYGEWHVRDLGGRVFLNWPEGNPVYMKEVSHRIVPALNGDPSMVSIISSSGRYLTAMADNPANAAFVSGINANNASDAQRASWRIKQALGA